MYKAICCCEGTGSQSTALGSAAASKEIASRKSLRLCGYVPTGVASKDEGVAPLKAPKTGVVDHSFLSERHERTNGRGTAQETLRLNGGTVSVLFLLHYDGQ